MKKKIMIVIAVLIIALGIVAWFYGYYNRKNLDNIPSKEIMVRYLQEKGEQYATEQLIGYSRDSLRYIWGEPDIMPSGLWGDGWNVDDNIGIIVFYDTDNKVESVQLGKKGGIFEATILEIKDTRLLVEPVEGSSELKSADQITVSMKNMSSSPELEVGDIIEIKYDGTIAESYPAQITEVYGIKVVKEAIKEDNDEGESEVQEATEKEVAETVIVSPLPTTIDLNNIKDCTLAVSIENGDIYATEAGTTGYTMKVKVYDYELFDLVDVSMLEVGNIIEINKEQIEITSIERNELGTVIINGGLDVGGYELATNEDGVFYSIGYSDIKSYHEIGEIELEISPEFIYINASDPDGGEKKYTVTDLTKNDVFFEYNGTPHNTSIVVEDDIVTSMIKVYTP